MSKIAHMLAGAAGKGPKSHIQLTDHTDISACESLLENYFLLVRPGCQRGPVLLAGAAAVVACGAALPTRLAAAQADFLTSRLASLEERIDGVEDQLELELDHRHAPRPCLLACRLALALRTCG